MSDLSENVVSLPCGHCFHEICVYKTLEYKSECAHCRSKISNTNGQIRKLFLFDVSRKEIEDVEAEFEKLTEEEKVSVTLMKERV